MTVREYYQDAISAILSKRNLRPLLSAPDFKVSPQLTVDAAIQYTDWYCHRSDTHPHYRYRRYWEALCSTGSPRDRLIHVDIGCGAGAFSWAFLDWAEAWGINYRQVGLFGTDGCPAMLQAAQLIRGEMVQKIPYYPLLNYHPNIKSLLFDLKASRQRDADFVITFGHILVQSHNPYDVRGFTQVIKTVHELTPPSRKCILIAVDARRCSDALTKGWHLLLESLKAVNIPVATWQMSPTAINNSNDVKLANLYRC